MTATATPAFKVGCRVDGKIRVYYVEDVESHEAARVVVEKQIPGASASVVVLHGAGKPIVKERA